MYSDYYNNKDPSEHYHSTANDRPNDPVNIPKTFLVLCSYRVSLSLYLPFLNVKDVLQSELIREDLRPTPPSCYNALNCAPPLLLLPFCLFPCIRSVSSL